jgi:hypothetical protein
MARPRTPTATLILRGSFEKDPQRLTKRAGEPVVDLDVGEPPQYLSSERRLCWIELKNSAAHGVLSKSDRIALEMAAHLLAALRADPGSFTAAKYSRLQSLLASFGMTPSDRSKVTGGATKKPNRFANNGRKGIENAK